MQLFETKKRTDSDPIKLNENTFDYFNRCNTDLAEAVRKLLNIWFDNYPESHKSELKKNFRPNFSSIFFELFIHELFRKQGFVLEPHPKIMNSNKKPEFLAKGHGIEFYIEAKEVKDMTEMDEGYEKNVYTLATFLRKINSPDFLLSIEQINFKSKDLPKFKKIAEAIENKVLDFNYDEIYEIYIDENIEDKKNILTYTDSKVEIVIKLIPREERNNNTSPILAYPFEFISSGPKEAIKSGLGKKAKKYGKLNKPYLICINSTSKKGTWENDIMETLFGNYIVSPPSNPQDINRSGYSGLDGFFLNNSNLKHKRVSAVFITNVNALNLANAKHWLIANPYAEKELMFEKIKLSKHIKNGNKIEFIAGSSIYNIMKDPSFY